MYTAEKHGATIGDYLPIELHCLEIDGHHTHYATQPASEGRQIAAYPVQRTDNGTGPSWYATGASSYFATHEGAAQYLIDRQQGVTRIRRGDVTERWQGGARIEDAHA